jgi:hypothetical protein
MIYYGNKDIINNYKTAFLCSRKCPADIVLKSLDWAKSKKDKGECVIPLRSRTTPSDPYFKEN